MKRIDLLPVMDREAVSLLLPELRDTVHAGARMAIHADKVDQIGQAGLQMLLSIARSAAAAGVEIVIEAPSDALANASELAGLRSRLPFAAAR
ncbi:hypothetical protein ACFB49_14190 [Sphingomonas sp. DBB INV C78]|uniref:STAS domain-containing protein n=1 Tax=Sphingomonas sp. DBB INV C78 TaxID=3349434 RepID=UPI0036D20C97